MHLSQAGKSTLKTGSRTQSCSEMDVYGSSRLPLHPLSPTAGNIGSRDGGDFISRWCSVTICCAKCKPQARVSRIVCSLQLWIAVFFVIICRLIQ